MNEARSRQLDQVDKELIRTEKHQRQHAIALESRALETVLTRLEALRKEGGPADASRTLEGEPPMRVLIAYATHEGHTGEIARHLGDTLKGQGLEVTVHDVASGDLEPAPFDRVVLASPVHLGRHQRALVSFIKRHRRALELKETALLSVGGATSAAEHAQDPHRRKRYSRDAQHAVEDLFKTTGWKAGHVEYVAGALLYRRYNWLMRFVMKGIAKSEGLSTDTTKDHDYTNWAALDRFAAELVSEDPPSPS